MTTASLPDTVDCASLHSILNALHAYLTSSQWSNVCGRAVCFTMLSASMEHGSTGQAAESMPCLIFFTHSVADLQWQELAYLICPDNPELAQAATEMC